MHLVILNGYGVKLGINGGLITYENKKESIKKEYPIKRIKTILISSKGVSLSSNFLTACSLRNIPVHVLDYRGVPIASVANTFHHGSVSVRRAQYDCKFTVKGMNWARTLIKGKIKNQLSFLKYLSKGKNTKSLKLKSELSSIEKEFVSYTWEIDKRLAEATDFNQFREDLFIREALCSKIYWGKISDYLGEDVFQKREFRGTKNYINMALNYGYGILSSQILFSIVNSGLDPYAGILHTDRPGKRSLVFDVMEEYRSWVVDRSVIKFVSNSKIKDFGQNEKKRVVQLILENLGKIHNYHGRKISCQAIIQSQVRKTVKSFTQDVQYRPYRFSW